MKLGTYNYGTGIATDTQGVVLGKFANQCDAREAMREARLPATFWFDKEVPPIPLLGQLNDWVISQNERRQPKWKFRFASDLAVQIQTKVTRAHNILFECVALQSENLTVKLFTEPKLLLAQPYWKISFRLFQTKPASPWLLKCKSAMRGRGCASSGYLELHRRIVEALHPDRFAHLTPDQMLSPQCICCGKGLTDPASMARGIGPECWGNGSTNIPTIFRTQERAQDDETSDLFTK